MAILDLDVEFKPCPMNGPTYRPEAMLKGGKRQVCDMTQTCYTTHSYVRRDSCICVTCLTRTCDITHSFVCVTLLMHMCDMPHSYV